MRGIYSPLILSIIACGAIIRTLAASGDLWLDEIWSFTVAQELTYPWEIFGPKSLDGHASLMTLWMGINDINSSSWFFRLPALFFGIGLLFLVVSGQTSKEKYENGVVALLFSFSFIFSLYGSEARGYSGMLFWGFAAVLLLQATLENGREKLRVAYGACVTLALLFHFSFLPTLCALILWSESKVNRRVGYPAAFLQLAKLHAIPLLTLGVLLAYNPALFGSGGGPTREFSEVLLSSVSVLFGGPEFIGLGSSLYWLVLSLLAVIGSLLIGEVILEWREKRPDIWLLILLSFGAPLLVIILKREFLFPRYFLFSLLCLLLIWGRLISRLLRGGGIKRALGLVCVLGTLGLNAKLLVNLSEYGRGQYRDAINYILSQDDSPSISISSDFDFRNSMVLNFHAARIQGGERVNYVSYSDWEREKSEWYLVHYLYPHLTPQNSINFGTAKYALEASFRSVPLSGWSWFIYRKKEAQPTP